MISTLIFLLFVNFQQDNAIHQQQRATLRGLSGIYVLVEEIKSDISSDGLSRDQIETDVELRLRKAGVRVLTQKQMLDAPGSPYLLIDFQSVKQSDARSYSFHLEVALNQNVQTVRSISPSGGGAPYHPIVGALTWKRALIGRVGATNLRSIRDDILDYVDQFINDYLAVNEK